MGAFAGPNTAKAGLKLALDPANSKSYAVSTLDIEYIIVAGGGGGGSGHTGSSLGGGGGGGGGLLYGASSVSGANTIVVGAGGTGADGPASNSTSGINTLTAYPESAGGNGNDSTAFGLTAIGGGGGGTRNAHENGKNGGSGGGACGTGASTIRLGGAGTAGQGSDGGDNNAEWGSSGGGGYSQEGESLSGSTARVTGYGGAGFYSALTGTFLAGGGGGGGHNNTGSQVGGAGGIGGGADGGIHSTQTTAPSGTANTGGGGGGAIAWIGNYVDSNGGAGGSGIVAVKYKGPQKAIGGDIIYETSTATYHLFNNSGTFEVGKALGDLSSEENTGIVVDEPTYSSGVLSYDGTNDYVNPGNFTDFFPSGSTSHNLSVELWARRDTTGNMVFFGNQSISNERLYIGVAADKYDFGWGSSPYGGSGGTVTDTVGDWAHLVLSVSSGVASLYVNGDFSFSKTDTAVNLTGVAVVGAYFTVGDVYDTGPSAACSVGLIKIYDRALTSDEIVQNFNATRGRYGV